MAFTMVSDIKSPTDYIQKIYEDAMFVARDTNLMAALVTSYSGQGMAPRSSSEWSAANIVSVNDDDDLTSQAFTPSVLSTLTPAEVGAQYLITDQRSESDPFGVQQAAAQELGAALAKKVETDLLSNFSSLTGGTVGTAGSVMSWGRFYAAHAQLRAQNPSGPIYCVLHPYHWHDLASEVAIAGGITNTPSFGDEVMRRYYVGTAAGVDIFTSANIAVDGSDDAISAMFVPQALALDIRRGVRIESERDASRRAWELNISAVYAHGVWRPKFGVKMIADATVPTA